MAEQAAYRMMRPRKEALKALKKEIAEEMVKAHLANIPAEIVALFKKYPAYFSTTTCLGAYGNGVIKENIWLEQGVVKGSTSSVMIPTEELAKKILFAESEEKAIKQKTNELIVVLVELRTTKTVLEQFPEAYEFIHDSKGNKLERMLPMNLNKLREEFQKK